MKICIDLDNTLVKLNDSWISKVSKELGYNYTSYDNMDWKLGCFPEDFKKRSLELFKNHNFMGNIQPIEGSFLKLYEWEQMNHNLTIITARPLELTEVTNCLVDREFPCVHRLLLVGWDNNKEDILRKDNFDVIIDDNPACIQAAINVKIPNIYIISNNSTRYNLSYIEKFKTCGVKIVKSICEVNL